MKMKLSLAAFKQYHELCEERLNLEIEKFNLLSK